MLQRYFLNLNDKEAKEYLKKNSNIPLIIRRTSDETDKDISFTIHSDDKKMDDNTNPFYYAINYVNEQREIKKLKFKSYETDPDKLNEKLEETLKYHDAINASLSKEKPSELIDKAQPSALIAMHRDARLRPEDILKSRDILQHQGTLIISTQTPIKTKNEEEFTAKPGKTGEEIQHILRNNPIQDKWVIITGHGQTAESVGGAYTSLDELKPSMDVSFSPKDYANILLQGGLKSGDNINILLYVCCAGAKNAYVFPLGSSQISNSSFAEKLAVALAEQGITSTIIASTSPVDRFTGYYLPDEKENELLKFRVKGGPEDIRVIRGEVHEKKATAITTEGYTEPFVISSTHIGPKSGLSVLEAFNLKQREESEKDQAHKEAVMGIFNRFTTPHREPLSASSHDDEEDVMGIFDSKSTASIPANETKKMNPLAANLVENINKQLLRLAKDLDVSCKPEIFYEEAKNAIRHDILFSMDNVKNSKKNDNKIEKIYIFSGIKDVLLYEPNKEEILQKVNQAIIKAKKIPPIGFKRFFSSSPSSEALKELEKIRDVVQSFPDTPRQQIRPRKGEG